MTLLNLIESQINPRPDGGLIKDMQLIVDKISRPLQTSLGRPRLLAMLDRSLDSGICTIISGRAGTGKTALAADFAACCNRRVAWYKVDAPDAEFSVFMDYLATSIGQQRPGFNEQAIRSAAGKVKSADMPLFSERLVFELIDDDSEPLLIVIEDLHLVCDTDWLVPFLDRFLQLAPPNVHILITSRTLPPAPLWRMRSKQTLEVIDEMSLAFTREEAVELFERYGLSRQLAYLAFDRTNGRAGALAKYADKLVDKPIEVASLASALNQLGISKT
jgi:ATP/maltotriose-dependent transcriptional regulator MalT